MSRAECRAQHGIDATLRADDDLEPIPPDISLCVYRVAQEALRNVVKHARAKRVDMVLTRADDGQHAALCHRPGDARPSRK